MLIGEVWICSGQSNMEFGLQGSFEARKDIAAATNPKLRLFTVAKAKSMGPLDKVKGDWKECTPVTAPSFSAVGYYFGRDLQKALGVPVGLIHTSWGGTPAQAWTSKEGLEAVPALRHYPVGLAARIESYDPAKAKEQYAADLKKYEQALADYREAAAKAKEDGKRTPQSPRRPGHASPRGNHRMTPAFSTTR